jgi:hypothetical protein
MEGIKLKIKEHIIENENEKKVTVKIKIKSRNI